jgi:hypothetical protein
MYTHFNAIATQVMNDEGITIAQCNENRGATFNDVDRTYATAYGGKVYYVFISADDRDTSFRHRTGSYTIPAGQGTTVFGFVSVSSPGGDASGNILDNITFASGNPISPGQKVSFTSEAQLSAATKPGYAYGLAEIRGSTAQPLVGSAAAFYYYYYYYGAGANPEQPITANAGGWYIKINLFRRRRYHLQKPYARQGVPHCGHPGRRHQLRAEGKRAPGVRARRGLLR